MEICDGVPLLCNSSLFIMKLENFWEIILFENEILFFLDQEIILNGSKTSKQIR